MLAYETEGPDASFNLVQWAIRDRENRSRQSYGSHLGLIQDDEEVDGGLTGGQIRLSSEGVAVIIDPVVLYNKGDSVAFGVGMASEIQGQTPLRKRHCMFLYLTGSAPPNEVYGLAAIIPSLETVADVHHKPLPLTDQISILRFLLLHSHLLRQ